MEQCVEKLQAKGYSKQSAIRVCKVSIFGRGGSKGPVDGNKG